MQSDFYLPTSERRSSTHDYEKKSQAQFLRFHLVPDTNVMLPIFQLSEVLSIPYGQIVPIPAMPAWVMGVYNWRGEILWMVDLGHLVGLIPWYQQTVSSSNHRAVVLNANLGRSARSSHGRNEMLGLVVNRIEDIEWCNPDEFYSPPASAVSSELATFLRGYWLKQNGEMLVALDGEAIMAAMPKP
ncbi:MAG: chemotaxis protein CheW [Gomphosphaeria aponina SAG 52.96 = DSM 107014]|uniref:Chemotaxis protein CheW n=1 Tax=Gomphosphaeria aponina SAG 52.96 = DSM 107014 TaxID=1521640 RepID=A0A941JUE1_9CHRO|nr:chemotaxis protein CheW [Gomphosphaeria aponina SAG 52.96 = DSM 107014]